MAEPVEYYPDMMVDIETTGLRADRAAILQIAAVPFNLETRKVDVGRMFDRCLAMPPTRAWEEGTRQWWATQKAETYNTIVARAEDPALVMSDFLTFCLPMNAHRFWAKPAHFDYPFISSYFHDFGLVNPFHYREVTCMNAYVRARAPQFNASGIEFNGPVHNALFDTLHQIKVLFAAEDEASAKTLEAA